MCDRYTRAVLTIIALSLVYLCVADALRGTPVSAQVYGSQRPGESTGPAEVVIVGWNNLPQGGIPVQIVGGAPSSGDQPMRVVLAGWEEAPLLARAFGDDGLPVRGISAEAPAPAVRVSVVDGPASGKHSASEF
jgi:hypothetical protein